MAQLAWEEAASLYGRAVAAAVGPPFEVADRSRLLLARARVQVRAYDVDGARQSLLAAADLAREAGDADTLAQASLVMEGVSDFLWDPRGRTLCAEALAGLPDGDSAVRARLMAQQVVADSWRSDSPDPPSKEALAMAERVGDRRAIVEALRARQIACSGPDGAEDRIELGDRLLAMGRDGDDDAALWGHLWRFDAYCQLGHLDRAEAECGPIDATANRMRSPLARWHALRSRAAITLARGRFADAEALGRQAMALARRAGHDGATQPSAGFLLMVRAQTGTTETAPHQMVDSLGSAMGPLPAIYAGWMLILGRREEAQRLYRTLPPPGSVPRFVLLTTLQGTAELAAEFNDRERAEEVYQLLTPFADLFVCGGAGVVAILGSARLPLGRAAATMGRLDDAIRHLRAAVEMHERAGMPPYAAHSRYHLASVLARRRRPGDRDEAAALATACVATAEQLGMAPLLANATELVTTLGGRGSDGPLTKREREIAVLVSQGLSNRQIAATAYISDRTVETHVQHILGKLGFTARTQIAAWVVAEKIRTEST
jgi:DNA-binding CsgD family transcriptional regulator/tetratricopeptide (TPR) repeat protein